MNFYSYKDIAANGSCLRYVTERLGIPVENGRCAAKWRGGTHPNVAVTEKEWFDHKTKQGGGLIELCCVAECGGSVTEMAKQQAQDILGNWLGLTPAIRGLERVTYDYRRQSTRYAALVNRGYSETRKYVYTDERGVPAHLVIRMEHPIERKEFIQCTPWAGSLRGVKTYLYNLPAVAASNWAIVVEGEKDADTLIALGLPATTCNNGAENWTDDYTESLRGKDVIICCDNDDAGREHAHLVLRSLADAAKTLRVICPSHQNKGDVTDWIQREGGTREKLYALMEKATFISKEEALWSDEALALCRAKKANKKTFSNTVLDTKIVAGKEKLYDRPLTITDLVDEVHLRMIGFPKKIGDRTLFDHDRDTNRIELIDNKETLIAWLGEKSKHSVSWKDGVGCVTKGELFAGLVRAAPRYEKISSVPDYPRRSDVYYSFRDETKPTESHAVFETFMKFFCPADESSRILLRTFFAAPMYYRPGIQRPCWIVDSRNGQGVGKTTVCELLAYLYNCTPIKTSKSELEHDYKELLKRIVSTSGRNSRILLVDNVKGVFDDERFSDLVTGFGISGKAPYGRGEENRPNDLTYIVTSNSANIGSDMASRSFILFLAPPKVRNLRWKESVMKFIDAHRYEILGDIHDILATSAAQDDFVPQTRVPEFEAEVLYPMAGSVAAYNLAIVDVRRSRDEANVDEDRANRVVEIIENELKSLLKEDPSHRVVFIRSNLVEYWMNNLNDINVRVQDIRNMVNTGRIACIDPSVRRYPQSSSNGLRSSGILFFGDRASVASCTGRAYPVAVVGMLRKGDASLVGVVADEKIYDEVHQREEKRKLETEASLLAEREPLFNPPPQVEEDSGDTSIPF